ncbi:hypothetical protein A0H81_01944 [Grifola frondosa]|uniref:Uncharacterized protein n=1 Tax=Grifola frondosa TaxID=5627 RepID=A0A1C7MNC5_GRIFR|nr:hypothetical protein A0H81_01944 [Grifola frondosa]
MPDTTCVTECDRRHNHCHVVITIQEDASSNQIGQENATHSRQIQDSQAHLSRSPQKDQQTTMNHIPVKSPIRIQRRECNPRRCVSVREKYNALSPSGMMNVANRKPREVVMHRGTR